MIKEGKLTGVITFTTLYVCKKFGTIRIEKFQTRMLRNFFYGEVFKSGIRSYTFDERWRYFDSLFMD